MCNGLFRKWACIGPKQQKVDTPSMLYAVFVGLKNQKKSKNNLGLASCFTMVDGTSVKSMHSFDKDLNGVPVPVMYCERVLRR